MTKNRNIFKWFDTVRKLPVPKFITGLRGTGKTASLLRLRDQLLAEGVSPANTLFIDTAAPSFRKFISSGQLIDYILRTLPRKGKSYVFIHEAAALPDAEVVIGTLAASTKREVFATSSSRRLLDHGLASYFSGRLAHFEVLPMVDAEPYTPELARARWNEIFLHDVLAPNRILEIVLIGRIAGWLSDNLGDTTSLRTISSAIAPTRRTISPHTIENHLAALEDAHLVEKVLRWDLSTDIPQKTGYKYFFTDPALRLAHFGPAPHRESRRMALNRAWLYLRHQEDAVFIASGAPDIHFVTCTGNEHRLWHMTPLGSLICRGVDHQSDTATSPARDGET